MRETERHETWNSAMERAAEIAEYYAGLYKSQGAQRAAEDIRACKLPLPSPENLNSL